RTSPRSNASTSATKSSRRSTATRPRAASTSGPPRARSELDSRARVGKRVQLGQFVTLERAGAPRVAAVDAFPDLSVREAGEKAAVRGDERVGHGRNRVR